MSKKPDKYSSRKYHAGSRKKDSRKNAKTFFDKRRNPPFPPSGYQMTDAVKRWARIMFRKRFKGD